MAAARIYPAIHDAEEDLANLRASLPLTIAFGALLLCACVRAGSQTVQPVPQFQIDQLVGKWFEAARYPVKFEKKCVGDIFVLFSEGNKANQFALVGSCHIKRGIDQIRNKNGRRQPKTNDGRLELNDLWPFHTKYWVLGVAPDSSWVVVGSPNRKTLWIYSRQATLPADSVTQAKSVATAQGFDAGKLISPPTH
jgi:apolipoprotein D and lipocalin family protein